MSNEVVEVLEQTSRWRAREVKYRSGSVESIFPLMPTFRLEDFVAGEGASVNPYLKAVVRQPMSLLEKPIAVGVVSNSYGLAQHRQVAEKCLDGLKYAGVKTNEIRCELGLTEFGEWMNFRLYFPPEYDFDPGDKNPLGLRLECFNSVDGSYRLVVLLGWLRFVCSNGMVIGETRAEIHEVHNGTLDLDKIPFLIEEAMAKVHAERGRLVEWHHKPVVPEQLEKWTNKPLTDAWGKKAACRVYHICLKGKDVDFPEPFAPGAATEKPVRYLDDVPGAAKPAQTLYEVSQALTWVATQRNDAEERLKWQSAVPALLGKL